MTTFANILQLMNKHLLLLLGCLLCGSFAVQAQNYTISGYLKDKATGETFIAANVRVKELPTVGVNTNTYGFYSLTVAKGTYTIVYSYLGYKTEERKIQLDKNLTISIEMEKSGLVTKETVIRADDRKDEQVKSSQMGVFELSTEKIKSMPAIFGEVDVLKSLQMLPGVQSAGEGQTGFYVRGGGPDQNLIQLDNATVYNTGHLLGFFSVFNSDAIKNTKLIKGNMPAEYGGRLSSVVDITLKEGNSKKMSISGGLGLISSRLTLEGPIKKNRSSFIISARRTYFDVLVQPFRSKIPRLGGSSYYFYDLNMKVNYRFTDRDRLYLSGYFGRDVFDFKSTTSNFKINMPWGNSTGTVRWNHLFNEKLFANTSIIFNNYTFDIKLDQGNFEFGLFSEIRDWNGKIDFDYYPSPKHHVQYGLNYTYHYFNPSAINAKLGDLEIKPNERYKKYAHEGALYLQDDWEISRRWKANVGLRYTAFQQMGPYDKFVYNSKGAVIDTIFYDRKHMVKRYSGFEGFEPRVSFRYELNRTSSLKASYSHNNQFIHLVSNNGTTLPNDIWVPSTFLVQPQISDQYALGIFKNFKENMFETSIEGYYKTMKHQIEYREFYVPGVQNDVEKQFVFGNGWSYGAEFFVNKQYGKFTGWVGYTLAWIWRKFPDLNNGEKYRAKYDRRHDVSVVASYAIARKWKLAGNWVFATGNNITPPIGLYIFDNGLYQQYGNLNSYRLPAYHRADLGVTFTPKPERTRYESSWTFSAYNIYSRFNPYFIYIDSGGGVTNGTVNIKAREVSLFPYPLPSVTWNFKF